MGWFGDLMGYRRMCQNCGNWFEVTDDASLCDMCKDQPLEDPEGTFELTLNDRKFLKSIKIVPK